VGVFLAANAEHAATLNAWCDNNPDSNVVRGDASRVYEQIPILAPGLEAVAHKPNDGILMCIPSCRDSFAAHVIWERSYA